MQSEDFDKKIRDAAERHHPAYDEMAWSKMEKLLDKHMPVEKERKRRILPILFLFLLLGGGAFLWLGPGEWTGGKMISRSGTAEHKNNAPLPGPDGSINRNTGERKNSLQNGTPYREQLNKEDESRVVQEKLTGPHGKMDAGSTVSIKKAVSTADRRSGKASNEKRSAQDLAILRKEKMVSSVKDPLQPVKDVKTSQDPLAKAITPDPVREVQVQKDPAPLTADKKPGASTDIFHVGFAPIDRPDNKADKLMARLSRKKGVLFLAASIAPDLSVVGLKEFGKIRTAQGFGIGYTKGRITLRSGLYSARKVYEAYPEDYKAPAAFYTRYPNLQEVKADCKVYEIPLLVSYNLKRSGNGHWFVGAGISSYLMKRETYDYYYKWNVNGPVVHRERTIRNANKHYFSVATLSAGYQRSLSKRISLVAEPYIKAPLTGIGFGKVKLNSAGVMVTVTYQPFGSKKRK